MTGQGEREFVENYLKLILLSKEADSEQFYSPGNYDKLGSLGPSLPKIQVVLPRKGGGVGGGVSGGVGDGEDEGTATLKFKSIKPPFKFSFSMEQVLVGSTVYKVKEGLIGSVEQLLQNGVGAADVKLLVKGKVILDTTLVSSLVGKEGEVSFMCMVKGGGVGVTQSLANVEVTKGSGDDDVVDAVAPTIPADLEQDSLQLSSNAWAKIRGIIVDDLGSAEKADAVLHKLRHGLGHV